MTPVCRMRKSRNAWKEKAVKRAEALREHRKEFRKEQERRKSAELELKRLRSRESVIPPPF
jgi:uncharacterized coiled-coil DUF342 family protein